MSDYTDQLHALRATAVQELDRLQRQPQPLLPIIAVVKGRAVELTGLIERKVRQLE
ncbi:hypothetical protein [Azospirillum sp. B2RO_4]|uniref:hypothetical protein n=1 Tax=Azospirillum sp. B2RO_4 TaxID=3027796 RepID=UPI003DA9A0A9